jgi:hypothetical protein
LSDEQDRDDVDFWYQIRLNAVSALVMAGGAAILWIGYKVPLQLDAILDNQKEQSEEIVQIKVDLKSHDRRITQLELRP